MPNKAIFLDKDSRIIKNVRCSVNTSLIRFTPTAVEGLKLLHKAGYTLFIITNQSEVVHNCFSEFGLVEIEATQRLFKMLSVSDLPLPTFSFCPHHPKNETQEDTLECDCRKPKPGLVLRTAQDWDIDLSQSWFIGDILDDVQAGWRAGCRTVLISNDSETEGDLLPYRCPDFTVYDLAQATRIIMAMSPAQEENEAESEYQYLATA